MSKDDEGSSGEWAGLGRDLKAGDAATHDEALAGLRELVALTAPRRFGCRMARGRLFGARISTASA